jgi:hypothetical protein
VTTCGERAWSTGGERAGQQGAHREGVGSVSWARGEGAREGTVSVS